MMLVRRLLLVFLLVVNLVLFFRLIWSDQGVFAYVELRNRYEELKHRVSEVEGKNLDLSREITKLKNDKAYQEKVVRERLRFVKPDEILYTFPGETRTSIGDAADDGKN